MPARIISQLALDPDAIRRRASSIVGCIEVPSSHQRKKSPTKSFGSKLSSPTKNGNNNNNNVIVSFIVGATGPKFGATISQRVNSGKSLTSNGSSSNNNQSSPVDDLARVTIYCDTGTIATARVSANGSIRHVFRRNVSSLDVVERCLKYPPSLPKIDWQLLSMTDNNNSVNDDSENNQQQSQSIKQNLELCDVGIAILQSECEKLALHANALSVNTSNFATSPSSASVTVIPSQTPTAAGVAGSAPTPSSNTSSAVKARTSTPADTSNSNRRQPPPASSVPNSAVGGPATTSGMEFQFSLAERPMKHVDQCLTDIQKMNKIVHAVSTNGIGTVFLYGNGGVAYTPNIPRTLYQKLSQLRYSKVHSSRPQYVSLGSRERYFVAFHDGTVSYKGPKGLDKELRKLTPPGSATTPSSVTAATSAATKQLWPLRSVAFGSAYDTFCIVFQDGSYRYHGKTFPKELEESLTHPSSSLQSNGNSKLQSSRSMNLRTNKSTYHGGDNFHQYQPADSILMSRQESNSSTTSASTYSNNNNTGGGRTVTPVTCINLGPSGEWFLRMDDGRMEWGGISEEMDEAIQQLLEDGHRLNYFDFGEDSSYFVSYD
jgi:hypothetical protein